MPDRVCPDDGTCHHSCPLGACFRVATCGPLSGVYRADEWPERVAATLGTWGDWEEGIEGAPEVAAGEIKAFDRYASNAGLIEAAARLGYLRKGRLTLDATWGYGTFWNLWAPDRLVALDRVLPKVPRGGLQADFTALPFRNGTFWATVFDGPYKLNGTPDEAVDERYGVHVPRTWHDRIDLLVDGAVECARVTTDALLVKCQDQVASGRVRWQTDAIREAVEDHSYWTLEDELYIEGGRPQPDGRRQVHARRNYSTLMVFFRAGRHPR